ncbi:MAG: glycerol kinase GlpK [Spirochaetota bacterium]
MSQAVYVGSLDQGTTSTRFILFNVQGSVVASHQLEHHQIYPKPGWVEHDLLEIWRKTRTVIARTMEKAGVSAAQIAGIGITNQRETVAAWNPKTGEPWHNAIVWQDQRGKPFIDSLKDGQYADILEYKTGLPLNSYFAGSKITWLLEHVAGLKEAAERGEAVIGTIDTWIVWNLTGGTEGGALVTDVTNASRYLLMDIENLSWDDQLLEIFQVPRQALPEIVPSVGRTYGYTTEDGPLEGRIPVCGILGDQQAALFGQACFEAGAGKNTYGTGCFLLVNTGESLVRSEHGLLTTVAYQVDGSPPVYALEGSIAVAGSLVQWTRDNLGLVDSAEELNVLAESVDDNGGVYFVPAFSGLFAPYWRSDARGVVVGLTGYVTAGHIARSVLEATAFQAKDIFDAMEKDSGIEIQLLKSDGGMTASRLLMQFQADILNVPVIRPVVIETTALGSAYAAGLTAGFWKNTGELETYWEEDRRWNPTMDSPRRLELIRRWHKAVERTYNWEE